MVKYKLKKDKKNPKRKRGGKVGLNSKLINSKCIILTSDFLSYTWETLTSLAKPKSATLHILLSDTNILRAARSRWIICRKREKKKYYKLFITFLVKNKNKIYNEISNSDISYWCFTSLRHESLLNLQKFMHFPWLYLLKVSTFRK